MRAVYSEIEGVADDAGLVAAERAIESSSSRLDKAVGIAWSVKPSVDVVYSAAMARPYMGKLMREHYRDLPDTVSKLIRSQIRLGYIEGETTNQVVARVRKITRGRHINMNRALINTTLSHHAGFAQMRLYKRNASSLRGIKWNATLDTKTSDFCIANGGKVFDVDNVPTYPAHYNERTVLTPVVKSAKDLPFDVPERTQASLDGQIPADISNIKWLDRQSFSRQAEAIGRRRAEILRDTDLSAGDLFRNSKLLPISEINKKFNLDSANIAA